MNRLNIQQLISLTMSKTYLFLFIFDTLCLKTVKTSGNRQMLKICTHKMLMMGYWIFRELISTFSCLTEVFFISDTVKCRKYKTVFMMQTKCKMKKKINAFRAMESLFRSASVGAWRNKHSNHLNHFHSLPWSSTSFATKRNYFMIFLFHFSY